jgi:hypothetical protein
MRCWQLKGAGACGILEDENALSERVEPAGVGCRCGICGILSGRRAGYQGHGVIH